MNSIIPNIVAHKNAFAVQKVANDLILVPLKGNVAEMNEMFTLNESGSFIWEQLTEVSSLETIVASLVKEFEVDVETAEQDVVSFLEKLSKYVLA